MKKNGFGTIVLVMTLATASVIAIGWAIYSTNQQKVLINKTTRNVEYQGLLQPLLARIFTDLQLASRYPEAVGLQDPPLPAKITPITHNSICSCPPGYTQIVGGPNHGKCQSNSLVYFCSNTTYTLSGTQCSRQVCSCPSGTSQHNTCGSPASASPCRKNIPFNPKVCSAKTCTTQTMPAASKYDIKPCTPLTSTVTTFCAAKDQWGRFNLDSYLVPKGINCPIPKTINVCINAGLEYANTGASVSCRVGEKYYNYDQTIAALYLPPASAVKVKVPQKQLKYPKGSVSLDYSQGGVLFPETDPVVTITRLSLTKPNPATSNPAFDQQYRYQLKVSFAACEVPIAGRSVAEVCTCPSGYTLRQPTNRGDLPYCTQGTLNATASCEPLGQYTKGVNWPSPCPTSQLHNIDYTGVINVDSAPFQEVIQAPIVATPTVCGDVNLPFQGSFLGLLSGQKVDGGNFAQGLQFTLTQSGTSVSGSAVGTGTSLDGTFSGTLPTPTSRTLSNVSVSFTGACTGTILGNNVTISSTGCRLTGSFSGALTSTVTGADCPNISNSTLDAMKSSSP